MGGKFVSKEIRSMPRCRSSAGANQRVAFRSSASQRSVPGRRTTCSSRLFSNTVLSKGTFAIWSVRFTSLSSHCFSSVLTMPARNIGRRAWDLNTFHWPTFAALRVIVFSRHVKLSPRPYLASLIIDVSLFLFFFLIINNICSVNFDNWCVIFNLTKKITQDCIRSSYREFVTSKLTHGRKTLNRIIFVLL